ncbi:cytochrome P450 86B1 [Prunus yedoensis var. nudiflora]|uniref:Cytochrome P450 86B1 n=1 Tax=Prunus yedoensis var. nudiflora TaxID=2094558 RepID=A0A314YJ66_PRUYE|nr:cytochrome P450 86B1 [Prunus yedoensis var. nudiflora]
MTNLLSFSAILNLVGFWDVAFALLGLFIISCLLERFTNKGPMLWPVLGIIPSVFLNVNNMYDWATVALIRAGGTFNFRGMWFGGAHGIITIDPSKLEYMLKTRFNNFPKGQYYRERFHDLLGDGIFNADDQMWKEQRRVATTEMHSSRNSVIDLQEVLLRFTFDNICTAALGVDPGCLALDLPQIPFAKAFEEATELTLFRFMVPPFVWKPMKRFEMGYEKRLKESVQIVHEFAEKAVTERRNELVRLGGLNDRSDLLARLMEYTDQNPEGQGTQKRFSNKFLASGANAVILKNQLIMMQFLQWKN